MAGCDNFAASDKHVYATRQTRIEAAHGAHDIDAFELVRAIFFKNRRVLDRIFIGSGNTVRIASAGIPAGRRMIVGDFLAGYRTFETEVNLAANQKFELKTDLMKAPAPQPSPSPQP
jgi:hypothetical protein